MQFNPGFNIEPDFDAMTFHYGTDTFGPLVEKRSLDAIRSSLLDSNCMGPETVYAIAMDVGKLINKTDLIRRNLLYGAVLYAKGRLGQEPIRSQGHIHAISKSVGISTPEVYEIWTGKAVIYMQETANDECGPCFAVEAGPGDIVVVPPSWAHATISADPNQPLTFGAWCVRDYGFDYEQVRAHKGLAYYPLVSDKGLNWVQNKNYFAPKLIIKKPRIYTELGIQTTTPIYQQYEINPSKFDFVANPNINKEVWWNFVP